MSHSRVEAKWRVGRKVRRTVYAQFGPEPTDGDPLIGVMDTAELALAAVRAHNSLAAAEARAEQAAKERDDLLRILADQGYNMIRGDFARRDGSRSSYYAASPSSSPKTSPPESSAADVDGADKPVRASGGHHESVGERQGRQPAAELPPYVIVGENGAYWRDFGDFYSMCPVSTDNDPIRPVAIYVLADTRARRLSTAASPSSSPGEETAGGPRCRRWIDCPLCGSTDTRCDPEGKDGWLIFCVNTNCPSNVPAASPSSAPGDAE